MTGSKIIHLKNVIAEDFINYKQPSMFLVTAQCDWKCCKELDVPISVCQNQPLATSSTKSFDIYTIVDSYLKNSISKSVVFGGLEPFMQFSEVLDFIKIFREACNDTVIIYTGYNEDELTKEIEQLKNYNNIIIKFGRYIPNQKEHFDETLGVNLASDNQYAKQIS